MRSMITIQALVTRAPVKDALAWRDPLYVLGLGLALFCAVMAIPFVVRAIDGWPRARRMCLHRGIRHLRRLRRFYRPAPIVDFVASLSLVSLFAATTVYFVTRNDHAYRIATAFWGALFVVCGALECGQRTRRLARYAWARTLGKVALAGLAAVVGGLAHIIARTVVFSIHPIEPSHYPNFILLMSLLLTPALYAYAVAILIAAWSYLEVIALLALPVLTSLPRSLSRLVGRQHAFDELIVRLIYGRRSSREPRRSLFQDGVALGLRAFSMTGFVIGLLWAADSVMSGHESFYRIQLTKALILADYQHGPLCGLDPTDHYLRLDDHRISVAHWHGETITFSTTTCPAVAESL